MEQVILVDETDQQLGLMEKLKAHKLGLLHRAISVVIFNHKGEMLIHRRSDEKYHSGGLWSNACCSHPRPNETPLDAAYRRLVEEMGLSCSLTPLFSFIYQAKFENGLIEHELDHVFIGRTSDIPQAAPSEVSEWSFTSLPDLKNDIQQNPEKFTYWFKLIIEKLSDV